MAWNESFERIRARMHHRMFAYQALFVTRAPEGKQDVDTAPWWAFWRKPKAHALSPAGDIVLRDLAAYCYVGKTTMKVSPSTQQTDPYAMAFAEGRRDVFNRITAMCNLTTEQIERIAAYRSNDE